MLHESKEKVARFMLYPFSVRDITIECKKSEVH